MKPFFCRFRICTVARMLLTLDMLRGMLFAAVLVGLFCGMATVQVEKLKEETLSDGTTRVDYFKNRETFVGCIVIGISICAIDILMALALDNILYKNLGTASLVWVNFSMIGVLLRVGFFTCLYKYEKDLGLHRLEDFTPTTRMIARAVFRAAVGYEAVKIAQIIAGVASQMEFRTKDEVPKKSHNAPKRVRVGMIGGSKRWAD